MKEFCFLFLFLLIIACTGGEDLVEYNDPLLGSWVEKSYSDSTQTFVRADSLACDTYGFSFDADGSFIECKNVGWCGTPPITYGIYEGTYSKNDSIISIEVPFWGGISEYTWQVVSLTDNELKIFWKDQKFEMDSKSLFD